MPRKQPSGAENRKKRAAREAAAKASGQLLPSAPSADQLTSLTGIIREKGKNYRDWKRGLMPTEAYWTSIKGLSALATAISARVAERQLEIDERAVTQLEALEGTQGLAIERIPASGAPMVGELLPRVETPNEVDE